jgi:methylenetetrahydrofolate reductase (NADPH)
MLSMELVPRTLESLVQEASACWNVREIQRINVPDIRRLDVRSHEAASALLDAGLNPVPHFRTRDRDLKSLIEIVGPLIDRGLEEILVVSGDPTPGQIDSEVTPIQAIQELRQVFPGLGIYAGLDPYRQAPFAEIDYAKRKLDAGALGLFSQPFFEVEYLQFWQKFFGQGQLWAGISPVQSQKTKEYWEKVNHVPFAKEPDTTPEGLAINALELLECAYEAGQHAYLMPIRMSAPEYLSLLADVEVLK